MEFKELKNKILKKELPSFVVLAGDIDVIQVYKEKIYSLFNITKINSITDYLKILQSKIQKADTTYLLEDDEIFKEDTTYWGIPFKNLIVIYTDLKKSDKFYKAFDKEVVMFDKLTDMELKGAIRYKLDIKETDLDWVVENCNHNYNKIMNEIDKVCIFPVATHQTTFDQFKRMNLFSLSDTTDAYAFVNSVTDRNNLKMIDMLNNMNSQDVLGNMTMVYNSLKNLLIVKTHILKSRDTQSRANELGMSKGLYYVLSQKTGYTVEELCRTLLNLIESMNNIKTGKIEALEALKLFTLTYLVRR